MEPERPIEKLLRESAGRRREESGAPFELHPATRRLLQGEVARLASKSPRSTTASGTGRSTAERGRSDSWFARFAWGLAIASGLVIAAFLMAPPLGQEKGGFQLAESATANRRAYSSAPAPVQAPAPAAAPAQAQPRPEQPALAYADKARSEATQANKDAEMELASRKAAVAPSVAAASEPVAPAPVSPPPPAVLMNADSITAGKAVEEKAVAPVLAGTPQAAPETLKKELSPAPGEVAQQFHSGVTQRFVEVGTGLPGTRDQRQLPAGMPALPGQVLASFDVQQDGNRLRLVDSDGSVYDGMLRVQAGEAGAPSSVTFGGMAGSPASLTLTNAIAPPAPGAAFLPIMSYSFIVSGTNRSLNAPVTVSGRIFSEIATNAMPLVAGQPVRGRAASGQIKSALTSSGFQPALSRQAATPPGSPPIQAEFPPLPLQTLRISGKAVIGQSKEVEINAAPDRSNTRPGLERR